MLRKNNLGPTLLRMVIALILLLQFTHAEYATAVPNARDNAVGKGPFRVGMVEYDAQIEMVGGASTESPYPYPERLRGVVHFPASAGGQFPVVLFVPGRHESCRIAGADFSLGPVLVPCPDAKPVVEDLPSWRGFDYLARNLASHGYVVMTINTNMVNSVGGLDGTRERAQLIRRSLELLAEWDEGERPVPDGVGDTLAGSVDLRRVGLMGHSRGADGVGYFIREEQERPDGPQFPGVRAVLELQGVDIASANPAPAGVHFGTIVGSCDADTGTTNVRPWERGRFVDKADRFARVLFHVSGANHGFFNSQWYDEWEPPPTAQPFPLNPYSGNVACSASQDTNIRLAREDQENIGIALINSFMRRYVGGETEFQPLMSGAASLPASACPTRQLEKGSPLPCREIVRTSYLAPAAERLVLVEPAEGDRADIRSIGFDKAYVCSPSSAPCPEIGNRSIARQLSLRWSGRATTAIALMGEQRDWSSFAALTLRTAMNPSDVRNAGIKQQGFVVRVIDSAGRSASAQATRAPHALARPLPDDGTTYEPPNPEHNGYRSIILNGIRVPLSEFEGVDLANLVRLEFVFGGTTGRGSIQISDIAVQRG